MSTAELPDRAEWRAQYFRLVAFPLESPLTFDQNWWSDLTGKQPETSTRKPHKREDSGTHHDVALSLEVSPFRVVWSVSPKDDPETEEFPTLGPAFERRDQFVELMGRWLDACPPIKRLSFLSSLLQFVDDKKEAYRRLDKYLHNVQVDVDTSDLMYRLNRQRKSRLGIKGLCINRLCTWAAATIGVGIHAVQQGGREVLNVPIGEQVACLLELDINTVPDFPDTELPHHELIAIFGELVDVGLNAAEMGDTAE